MDVILATKNSDKVREIREILPDSRIRFLTMTEAGFDEDIIEDGDSFQANALIKARAVHQVTGGYVLADDSGLAVDLLDGAPGIYSARFAGEQAGYPEKIARLHDLLSPWPPDQWAASFICAMALIRPDGEERVFMGECRGRISTVSRGNNGFGYDPVFLLPDRGLTTAELSSEEKHGISHRGQALRAVAADLLRDLEQTTLLVFSDSHGSSDFIQRTIAGHPEAQTIIHLGDHAADYRELSELCPLPLLGVAGNCDGWHGRHLPAQRLIVVAGYRLFLTHGHHYGVKQQLGHLLKAAANSPNNADIILFGHTHQALKQNIIKDGRQILLINPGSSRQGFAGLPASAALLHLKPGQITVDFLLDQP